jgi:hypothetical protein
MKISFIGATQFFAAIGIALTSDFLPPRTFRANEMEATPHCVTFERLKQQLANPHEGANHPRLE